MLAKIETCRRDSLKRSKYRWFWQKTAVSVCFVAIPPDE
jgi:hypothetical protein